MKKIVSVLAVVALAFAFVTGIEVKAAGVSGSMSGPSSAKAGETITISLNVNASECTGANGQIVYDSSKATVNSVSTPLSNWASDYNTANGKFIVNDNNVVGVSGSQTVLKISVTLASNLTPGESVSFDVSNCLISYDGMNFSEGEVSASYTVTIVEPVTNPPAQNTPTQNTPSQSTPSQNTPSQSTPSQSVPSSSQSTASQNSAVQDNSADDQTAADDSTKAEESTDVAEEDISEEDTTEVKESDKDEDKEAKQEGTLEKVDNEAGNQGIWIWVVIILVALAILGCLLFFLIKRKKDE